MTTGTPAACARCSTALGANFRFCPECGLPVSGGTVLSTEIAEQRSRVEASANRSVRSGWRRYLLPTASTAMLAFVVAVGLVLFNKPLLNRMLPPAPPRETGVPHAVRWEPDWITIPPGRFPIGEPGSGSEGEIRYAYNISKYEIPNSLWLDYLVSERSRIEDMSLWQESFPSRMPGWSADAAGNPVLAADRRLHPIARVSPTAIAHFCAWLTRRLNSPGWEIRMPTQLEWEYAARGTRNSTYTWGDGDVILPIPHRNVVKERTGIRSSAFAVNDAQLADDDRSPFGVVAMGTNVSEWTVMPDFAELSPGAAEVEIDESLPIQRLPTHVRERYLNVARRGASWGCDAELARRRARPFWKLMGEPTELIEDAGVRLVKVRAPK